MSLPCDPRRLQCGAVTISHATFCVHILAIFVCQHELHDVNSIATCSRV